MNIKDTFFHGFERKIKIVKKNAPKNENALSFEVSKDHYHKGKAAGGR